MNGIPMVAKDTDLYLRGGLTDMIYLMLLSDCLPSKDKFISLVSKNEIMTVFSVQFPAADVKKALEQLKVQRLIEFSPEDNNDIILGDVIKGKVHLFINQESKISLKSEFSKAEVFLARLTGVCRDSSLISYANGMFSGLSRKSVSEYTYQDVYNLYKLLYILTVQERSRDLTQKEYGLLQTLCKQFSTPTAVKIIFQYFLFSLKYKNRGGVSVSSLYYIKDRLKEDVRGVTVDDKEYVHDDETV